MAKSGFFEDFLSLVDFEVLQFRSSTSAGAISSGRLRGARILFGGGLRPLRLPARDFSGSGG